MPMDHVANQSGLFFDQGYHCAESVLMAVCDHYGIRSPLIPKIATGFCSGVARTGGMCGAFTGAVMAVNLFAGRETPKASIEKSYRAVNRLTDLFNARFGTTSCPELIGCRLDTEAGQRRFMAGNLIAKCRQATVDAAAMAMQVISEILQEKNQIDNQT
jgi:C_GCAxxG_C_C family probable redox protein